MQAWLLEGQTVGFGSIYESILILSLPQIKYGKKKGIEKGKKEE